MDSVKAEIAARLSVQRLPPGAHRLEQREAAVDVGGDEWRRSGDRAVDVGLGGEVEQGARLVARQQAGHQVGIADVAVHEQVARIAGQRGQVVQVAGVGELVEVDDRLVAAGQPVENEIGADEACSACH